jgi:putative endonuclease
MTLLGRIASVWKKEPELPANLRHGKIGEAAARVHLQKAGLKFLTSNFSTARGEIDLIFREVDCLIFVEVKTRSREDWSRPADAVHRKKKERISATARLYLRQLKDPFVKIRFDIVEVLLDGEEIREIRHLPNGFTMRGRSLYGEGARTPAPRRFQP